MSNDDIPGTYNPKQSSKSLIAGIIVAVGVAAFFAGMYFSNSDSEYITQKQLDDSIAKLELKILQSQLSEKQQSPPVRISLDDDPVIGDPNAPITIVEFSDFQCPFCARFNIQTLPLLMEEYIDTGKVKLVFRDFPITSIHPNALPAALAAECANEQDKFKGMHDIIFENQNVWNKLETNQAVSVFSQYATELNLDQEKFDSCLLSAKYVDEIRNDLDDGREYGVSGTPGFFIGNDQVGFVELKGAQPFENFKKVLDAQLG